MIQKKLFFIHLGEDKKKFNINNYIAVKSNALVNGIANVHLYVDDVNLNNPYIERLEEELFISINKVPKEWDLDSPHNAHRADFLRLNLLYCEGGVYSDIDSVAFSPFHEFIYDSELPIFCLEKDALGRTVGLCNGFMLSPPKNPIIKEWIDSYKDYDPEIEKPGTPEWTKHSVRKGLELYNSHLSEMTILPTYAFEPFYLDYDSTVDLFFIDKMDYLIEKNPYQVHLWETRNYPILKVLNKEYFMEGKSTYSKLGKNFIKEF